MDRIEMNVITGERKVVELTAEEIAQAQTFQDNYYKEHNIVRTAWNKGTKGVMTAWNKGVPMSEASKQKLSESQLKRFRKAH